MYGFTFAYVVTLHVIGFDFLHSSSDEEDECQVPRLSDRVYVFQEYTERRLHGRSSGPDDKKCVHKRWEIMAVGASESDANLLEEHEEDDVKIVEEDREVIMSTISSISRRSMIPWRSSLMTSMLMKCDTVHKVEGHGKSHFFVHRNILRESIRKLNKPPTSNLIKPWMVKAEVPVAIPLENANDPEQ